MGDKSVSVKFFFPERSIVALNFESNEYTYHLTTGLENDSMNVGERLEFGKYEENDGLQELIRLYNFGTELNGKETIGVFYLTYDWSPVYVQNEELIVFVVERRNHNNRYHMEYLLGAYYIDTNTLYIHDLRNNKENMIYNENYIEKISYEELQDWLYMEKFKNEIWEYYESKFENLAQLISSNIDYENFVKSNGTYHKSEYSRERLRKDIVMFYAMLIPKDERYSEVFMGREVNESLLDKTEQIWVVMKMPQEDNLQLVSFNLNNNFAWYVPFKNLLDKSMMIKYVQEAKKKDLELMYIPSEEDTGRMAPTQFSKGDYVIQGISSCRDDEIRIRTRWNDTVYEDTDPMKRVYGSMNVMCKINGGLVPHKYLKSIRDIFYGKEGCFYIKEQGLCYLKNGLDFEISLYNTPQLGKTNLQAFIQDGNFTYLYEFEKIIQTEYQGHYDTNGYLDEYWQNSYEIKRKRIDLPIEMLEKNAVDLINKSIKK